MNKMDTQRALQLKNSVYNSKNGRYVLGGKTEVTLQTLQWWDRVSMEPDPSDLIYFMEKKYEGRADMLGYVFYGDPGMWWVIAQFNNILDPFSELVEGKMLIIPTLQRLKSLLVSNVGGIEITSNGK